MDDNHNNLDEVNRNDPNITPTNLNAGTPNAFDQRDEEVAQEFTVGDERALDNDKDVSHIKSAVGWIGLALSIISFFVMPIIFGGAGIIMGFIAKSRDADVLGNTAIIAGIASILITLFVIPNI